VQFSRVLVFLTEFSALGKTFHIPTRTGQQASNVRIVAIKASG